MAKPVKRGPLASAIRLVRKKTLRGAELLGLKGGLGEYSTNGFDSGKMTLHVTRTFEGLVRFSLLWEGQDGQPETRVWVELNEDELPHLMRVLML